MDGTEILYAVVAVLCLLALLVAWGSISVLHSRNKNLYDLIESQNATIDQLLADLKQDNW